MSWFKVDDRFHSHPKIVGLPIDAIGLWVLAGAYCADYGTGGVVPVAFVRRHCGRARVMKRLTRGLEVAGLWRPIGPPDNPEAWQFHDWTDHNPTAEEEAEKRRNRAESGRIGGIRSGEARRSKLEANSEARASSLLHERTKQKRTPSRPVPIPDKEKEIAEREPDSDSKQTLEPDPPTDREGQYRAAYCRGIAAGTGRPFVWPDADDHREQGALNQALPAFARDPQTGKPLRGSRVDMWIEKAACAFAKDQAENEPRYRSYKAKSFLAWLNRGPSNAVVQAEIADAPMPDEPAPGAPGPPTPEQLAQIEAFLAGPAKKPNPFLQPGPNEPTEFP